MWGKGGAGGRERSRGQTLEALLDEGVDFRWWARDSAKEFKKESCRASVVFKDKNRKPVLHDTHVHLNGLMGPGEKLGDGPAIHATGEEVKTNSNLGLLITTPLVLSACI